MASTGPVIARWHEGHPDSVYSTTRTLGAAVGITDGALVLIVGIADGALVLIVGIADGALVLIVGIADGALVRVIVGGLVRPVCGSSAALNSS